MGMNEHGFLSTELESYRLKIRSRQAPYVEFVERVNAYCQEVKFRLNVHNRDGQQVFAAALFIKILCDAQAAALLIERGLTSQAGSLLRVATEALIILAKICQSYEFVEAYLRIGERQRLKLVKAIKRNPGSGFDGIRNELTDELIEGIVALVGESGDANVQQWASDVGLLPLYDAIYRLFSQEVHSTPRALERYLEADEAGDFKSFDWGPNVEENLKPELIEASRILIVALHNLNRLFSLDIEEQLAKFTAELAQLDREAG